MSTKATKRVIVTCYMLSTIIAIIGIIAVCGEVTGLTFVQDLLWRIATLSITIIVSYGLATIAYNLEHKIKWSMWA